MGRIAVIVVGTGTGEPDIIAAGGYSQLAVERLGKRIGRFSACPLQIIDPAAIATLGAAVVLDVLPGKN